MTSKISNFLSSLINLTKPRIISLLLITAMTGMYLASPGNPPDLKIILFVLLGGALAAGGANSINNYLNNNAHEMRQKGKDKFDGSLSIKRRILSKVNA